LSISTKYSLTNLILAFEQVDAEFLEMARIEEL